MAFLMADGTYQANGVTVNEYLLTRHNPNRISMPSKMELPLIGVTIHNTDSIKVSGTTQAEQYTRATVNGNMGTVRVHFYVDEVEAWQNLPLDWQGWHAADGSGKGNTRTIAIECIGSSDKAEDNAARLIAWLLEKFGLNADDNLFTHTYWLNVRDSKGTGLTMYERCILKHPYKVCPAFIIPHFRDFINRVKGYMPKTEAKPQTEVKPESQYLYRVCIGTYSVEKNARERLKEIRKAYPDAFLIKTVKK